MTATSEQPTVSLARAIGRPSLDAQDEGRRVERLPGVNLDLKIGGPLTLHFTTLGQKFEGKVVGYEPFAYLIVQARIPAEVLARITGNTSLVAQHTVSGAVFGFRSQVLNRITNPTQLLFLAFPDSVDRVVLRRDERVSVNVPSSIHGKYGEHEAMILDLTASGCQLSAKVDLKNPLREARTGDQLILTCDMSRSQVLTTPIVLRRVFSEKGLLFLGTQFKDLTSENLQLVNDFVGTLRKFMSS